jgi:hypothetical protein
MSVSFLISEKTDTLNKVILTTSNEYSSSNQATSLRMFNDFEKFLVNKYGKPYLVTSSESKNLTNKVQLWHFPSGTVKLEYIVDVGVMTLVHIDYTAIEKNK